MNKHLMNDGPLSEGELDELDDFLLSDITPEDCMSVSMLDGFLTALAAGPLTLPPSGWLPEVFGGEMIWPNQPLADRIMSLILRHANKVSHLVIDEPEEYQPLFYLGGTDAKPVSMVDEWCGGFVHAMQLDEAAWSPFADSEAGNVILFPIWLFGSDEGMAELERHPDLDDQYEVLVKEISLAVMMTREFFRTGGANVVTIRHAQPKPGRNDPCSCGSGKKFKKCCGAAERLH